MFISRWRIPQNESFPFGVRPFINFLASSVTSEQTLISWFAVILNLCDITTDHLLAICLFLHLNSLYDRCEYFHLKLLRRFMEDVNTQTTMNFRSFI